MKSGMRVHCVSPITHTPDHTLHRLARTSEIRTVLEAHWLVRAPVPISGSRGSHGGLGGRSDVATLNRPLLRGRGAAADTLNGSARHGCSHMFHLSGDDSRDRHVKGSCWGPQEGTTGHGVRKHLPPRASNDQKNNRKKQSQPVRRQL